MNKREKMKLAQAVAAGNAPSVWKRLPEMRTAGVRSASRAMVPLAAAIDATDALFLSVVLSNPGDRRRTISLHSWTQQDGVLTCLPYEPGKPERGQAVSRMITHHLLDMFADIVRRWPRTAIPRQIGIITDGHGICFHPAYPDGIDPRWLHAHLSGRDPACEILPVSPEGYLGVICAGVATTRH
ncbi:hypothetical protein [Sphingomonas sp. 3-13AW]|uniref:hypothetical protein n=1 Tax=Sphingomonas sp. 3-13AW TaxID=3050450 RepID=UPI003BB62D22